MFRTISGPVSPWESLLPPVLLRLPEELARVDALLDDPAFFAPFAPYFHPLPPRRPGIRIGGYRIHVLDLITLTLGIAVLLAIFWPH